MTQTTGRSRHQRLFRHFEDSTKVHNNMYKHIFSDFLTCNVTPQSKELIEMS